MELSSIIYILICLGLILLPFSTDKNSLFGVISFGAPVLFMAAFLIIVRLIFDKMKLSPILKSTVFISFLYVTLIVCFSFIAPAVIPSLARASLHLIGFSLFLFIISLTSHESILLLKWQNKLIISLIASGTILAIYFITHLIIASSSYGLIAVMSSREPDGLMSLPWGTSNTISAILIFPLIATLVNMNFNKRYNYLNVIALSMITLAIAGTLSRAGILLLSYIFMASLIISRRFKLVIFFLILCVSTVILLNYYSSIEFESIFAARFEIKQSGRGEVWSEYLQYIHDYPFEPIGYYGSLYRFDYSGHNLILTTLVELGFIGLFITIALYFSFFLCILRGITRTYGIDKKMLIIYLIGLSAVLMNMQIEDPQYTQQYIIYFWIFTGLICLSCMPKQIGLHIRESQPK